MGLAAGKPAIPMHSAGFAAEGADPQISPRHHVGHLLSELRLGWVADQDGPKTAKPRPHSILKLKLQRSHRAIVAESRLLLDSIKQGFHNLRRAADRSREQAAGRFRFNSTSVLLLGVLAALVAMGALVYAVSVQYIFDPDRAMNGTNDPAPTAQIPSPPAPSSQDDTHTIQSLPSGSSRAVDALANLTANSSPPPAAPQVSNGVDVDKLVKPDVTALVAPAVRNSTAISQQNRTLTSDSFTLNRTTASANPPMLSPSFTGGPSNAFSAAPAALSASPVSSAHQVQYGIRSSAAQTQQAFEQLDFAHALAEAGRSRSDLEATALSVIERGGRVDFDVQHIDRAAGTAHPVRVSVTGNMLQCAPGSWDQVGTFTVQLSAISSLQVSERVLTIAFRDSGGKPHRVGFADFPSDASQPASPNARLIASLRNVLSAASTRQRSR